MLLIYPCLAIWVSTTSAFPIPDRKQSRGQGPTSQRPWKPKLVIFRRSAVEQDWRGEKQTLHHQFSVNWDLRQTYQLQTITDFINEETQFGPDNRTLVNTKCLGNHSTLEWQLWHWATKNDRADKNRMKVNAVLNLKLGRGKDRKWKKQTYTTSLCFDDNLLRVKWCVINFMTGY